jgi:anaerobic ribonucleoside-triphosphate reductase activating protein
MPEFTTMLRVSRIHFPVTALGPGRRVGVWVQGCAIGCRGCVSRDTWDAEGGQTVTVDAVAQIVERAVPAGCTGVTISGGEPFDQASSLRELIPAVRDAAARLRVAVDVLCYSGYAIRRLRRAHASTLALLDGVIAGPFVDSQPTDLALRGSANQELVILSELGRARYGALVDARPAQPAFQIAVSDREIAMIGIPRRDDLSRLTDLARARGVHVGDVSWSA